MEQLENFIRRLIPKGVVIAFSGGVDSSLLLKVASIEGKKIGADVYAVTFETKLHPQADLEIAKQIAKNTEVIHDIIFIDELTKTEILKNPIDRCYHCKRFLFEELIKYAKQHNLKYIIDGTNVDDLSQYRPGIKALNELGIISPLAQLKIDKATVRKYAKKLGLNVHNRPSAPCLATRIPYNIKLDMEILKNIDKAETFLKELGFVKNRVRLHKNIIRIEVDRKDIYAIMECSDKIIKYFKGLGFLYITLDLEGFRSGSMDIHLLNGDKNGYK
ncbi:TIGR00268 family protein [Candidatus Epulonipiscioides gigas]|nr:TIGR00268 family protein [Epulopiscium sp. SCG-C07WGA-EpuloA2]